MHPHLQPSHTSPTHISSHYHSFANSQSHPTHLPILLFHSSSSTHLPLHTLLLSTASYSRLPFHTNHSLTKSSLPDRAITQPSHTKSDLTTHNRSELTPSHCISLCLSLQCERIKQLTSWSLFPEQCWDNYGRDYVSGRDNEMWVSRHNGIVQLRVSGRARWWRGTWKESREGMRYWTDTGRVQEYSDSLRVQCW